MARTTMLALALCLMAATAAQAQFYLPTDGGPNYSGENAIAAYGGQYVMYTFRFYMAAQYSTLYSSDKRAAFVDNTIYTMSRATGLASNRFVAYILGASNLPNDPRIMLDLVVQYPLPPFLYDSYGTPNVVSSPSWQLGAYGFQSLDAWYLSYWGLTNPPTTCLLSASAYSSNGQLCNYAKVVTATTLPPPPGTSPSPPPTIALSPPPFPPGPLPPSPPPSPSPPPPPPPSPSPPPPPPSPSPSPPPPNNPANPPTPKTFGGGTFTNIPPPNPPPPSPPPPPPSPPTGRRLQQKKSRAARRRAF